MSGLLVTTGGSGAGKGRRRLVEAAAVSWLPRGKSPASLSFGGAQVGCVNTMGDMSREGARVAGTHGGEVACSRQIHTEGSSKYRLIKIKGRGRVRSLAGKRGVSGSQE